MSNPRFQKIDETNIGDHTRILESDRILFLREYTAQKGFSFSDTNNLISNLKKKKGDGGFRYKSGAIDQCAREIFGGLNPDWLKTACLIPIPPSKCKTDEAYDDRVLRICNGIAAKAPFPVDVRELITQADSLRAAHESSDRPSVEELMANYEFDEALCTNPPDVIGIVDVNRLQIDGAVADVMNVEPLADRYRSFGWLVIEVDGHDMEQVVNAFDQARNNDGTGKPTVILANTVKGKGVSFMENIAGWHGRVPNFDELVKSLKELGLEATIPYHTLLDRSKHYQAEVDQKLAAKMPRFSRDYWWNTGNSMTVAMKPTRMGFGESLAENGNDERVVCLGLDISGSITISEFYAKHPERKNRWLSMGIA